MNKLKNITLPELTQVSWWNRILRFFNIIESEYTSNNYGICVVAINVQKNKWMLYDKSSNRFYDIISANRWGNTHLWDINENPGSNYINDCIGSRKDVHNAVIRLTNKKDIIYDIENAINNIKNNEQ